MKATSSSLLALTLLHIATVAAYDVLPRWGQAASIVRDVLFVHGGKVDEWNEWGYSTAPTTNDILFLSLSNAFDTVSPPWDYVGGSFNSCSTQGPSAAYHTISAYSSSGILSFGGAPSPGDPYQMRGYDSAALLDIWNFEAPSWTCTGTSWGNEPMRRIRHSAGSFNGRVYLVGGLKADGSGEGFSDHSVFDPNGPSFSLLSNNNGPLDIWGQATVMLTDGRMLVLGGYIPSASSMNPFSNIWILDTTQGSPSWSLASVSQSSLPGPRVGFAATAIDNGRVIIQGGSDNTHQTVYSDGWILDTTQSPWSWARINSLDSIGQRMDHFAVYYGSSVVFGFGYGENHPASPAVSVFDVGSSQVVPHYTPPITPTIPTTLPGASPTNTYPHGGSQSGSETMGSGTATNPNASSATGGSPGSSGTGTTGTGGAGTGAGAGTGTNPGGSQATGGNGSGSGHDNGSGSGHDNGSGSDSSSGGSDGRRNIAIALGVIFGLLGLVAGVMAASYYIRQRQAREHPFFGLSEDEDDLMRGTGMSPIHAEQAHMMGPTRNKPGMFATIASAVRLGGAAAAARHTQQRRNMLTDEDGSMYEYGYNPYYEGPRRHGSSSTGGSATTGGRRLSAQRPKFGALVQDSLASLRSVAGAMFVGGTVGAAKNRSREPSTRSEAWSREKDVFSDHAALMGTNPEFGHPERPRGGRQYSSASSKWSYQDPFADHAAEFDPYDDHNTVYDGGFVRPVMPGVAHASTTVLSPVYEQSGSSNSHGNDAMSFASGSNSNSHEFGVYSSTSHDTSRSPGHGSLPRPSSMLDARPEPQLAPVRRSDSWWNRFAAKSFLDRRSSVTSNASNPVDFRDPNPVPRLSKIEEGGSHGPSPESATASSGLPARAENWNEKEAYAPYAAHRKSASSLQTTKTADTAGIEQIGNYVVLQRDNTGSTHSRSTTDGSDALAYRPAAAAAAARNIVPRPLSVVISTGSHESHSSEHATVYTQSPTRMEAPESLLSFEEPALPAPVAVSTASPTTGRIRSPTGNIASRVAMFEQHAQDAEQARSPPPLSPDQRNTRKVERWPGGNRPAVAYGLIPKPSLYVANPDRSATASNSSTPP